MVGWGEKECKVNGLEGNTLENKYASSSFEILGFFYLELV